ncbi:MAG: hypothetical protein K0R57_4184 [Paenibacillaceae bacterium]|jgi:ABC-2 type transport system permease protein|nr:hypothetical protein [Paenibacillaceae bacterium]
MRLLAYTWKSLLETVRDWKLLVFTLFFAPCFVFVLYAGYGGGNSSFRIDVFNLDGPGAAGHGAALVRQLEAAAYPDGTPLFRLNFPRAEELQDTIVLLEKRSRDAAVVLSAGTSEALEQAAAGKPFSAAPYKLYGDPRNNQYALASIYLATEIETYMQQVSLVNPPLVLQEELIGSGEALTDFDYYIPGLVVLAFLNVLFTAGAAFIREIEKGTMLRLKLSRLKAGEMIGGISLVQLGLGLASFVLTLAAARLCGFTWKGELQAVLLTGLVSMVGVLGLTLVAVSFMRSLFDVMTVGMVPYFLVMFFAGIFFPLPPLELFSLGGAAFGLNDLLPLSLSVSALNQTLNFGATIGDIGVELALNLAVAACYLALGLWLFRRRHMRVG